MEAARPDQPPRRATIFVAGATVAWAIAAALAGATESAMVAALETAAALAAVTELVMGAELEIVAALAMEAARARVIEVRRWTIEHPALPTEAEAVLAAVPQPPIVLQARVPAAAH
jgi:hypothetical protein